MAKLIVKGHSVPKDRSNHTKNKIRDLESLPDRERMREHRGWHDGPRDHLTPLFNYLKANIGRPWAQVYKEICNETDARSFEGRHLREHIEGWVISEEEVRVRVGRRYGSYHYFYYDANGILHQYNKRTKYRWDKKQDPNECEIAGNPYSRVNGCWFESIYKQIQESVKEYDLLSRKIVDRLYNKRVALVRRQLNKKELKRLGLSNEPGWEWYKQ
jgi:hypothetical protein